MTLNLLRTSRLNNKLSAYEQLEGTYDFNRRPMAPLGIKVQAYEMPTHRGTWDEHATDGWYIGPAPNHYQCYKVLTKITQGIKTPPRVKFSHTLIPGGGWDPITITITITK